MMVIPGRIIENNMEILEEEYGSNEIVEFDGGVLLNPDNVEKLNAELDLLTSKPYVRAHQFLMQIRGQLERYGIKLPPSLANPYVDISDERVYLIGDTNWHIYMIYDLREDGLTDGYASIVDEEELEDLLNMDEEDLLDLDDSLPEDERTWIPPARRDDDSGNSDEY